MAGLCSGITRGIALCLILCGIVGVGGCKTSETASGNSAALRFSSLRPSEPDWKLLANSRTLSSEDVRVAGNAQPDALGMGLVKGSDLQMVELARNDLRQSVQNLAEAQIARERIDMQQEADARLEARLRQLQVECDRDYKDFSDKNQADCSLQIKNAETEVSQSRTNLRLKLAAVTARIGQFGGTIDAQAASRAQTLKSELARLDEQQADRINRIRNSAERDASELRKKQSSAIAAKIAELRKDAGIEIADWTKARRDRLNADLAKSVSEDTIGAASGKSAVTLKTEAGSVAVNDRASASAEHGFDQALADARASMRKRQNEIRQREREDYITAKRS